MRISEVARRCGTTSWWIRRAERSGRIPPAARTSLGQREWTEADLERITAALGEQREEERERWKAQGERLAQDRRDRELARESARR